MDSKYETEQCKKLLKRSFLPRAQLRVRRRIHDRRAAERLARVSKPEPQVLQLSPIFQAWPVQSIGKLLSLSWLEYKQAGMAATYCGEPRETLCLYWVVSGKLTQLPTKRDIVRCSLDIFGPNLSLEKVVPTGPLVFPSLFRDQSAAGTDVDPACDQPLSQVQEAVLDGLLGYSAAQLVDGDSLLLGDTRQRSVRCQSEAVLLAIPLSAVVAELATLKPAVRQATISAAREAVLLRLAKSATPPSVASILDQNCVLQELSMRAMKEIWSQLRPHVFCAGESICADIFTSDRVYFLHRGQVAITTCSKSGVHRSSRLERRHAAAIGVNSFASYELPMSFEEKQSAKAHRYCELWSVPLTVFIAASDAADEVGCSRRAAALIAETPISQTQLKIPSVLAQVPAFLSLSEAHLQAIAASMRIRVHPPGKVIVSPAKGTPVKEGLVVLCGKCTVVSTGAGKGRGKRELVTDLRPGVASFFCEALLSRPVSVMLQAETSVVALHASPGAIMDALDSLNDVELRAVIDAANEYVMSVYGAASGIHDETPQERAMLRVREHDARQKAMLAAAGVSSITPSDTALASAKRAESLLSNEKIAENGILTSLTLQLQSLHFDDVTAKRHRFFHNVTEGVGMMEGEQMGANEGWNEDHGKSHHPATYFTLSANGELLFKERNAESGGDGSDTKTVISPPPSNAMVRQIGMPSNLPTSPPAPPRTMSVQQPPPAYGEATNAADRSSLPLFLSARPPAGHSPRARSLHAPFTVSRTGNQSRTRHTGTRAAARPTRLAALHSTAEQLKNEADGFFPQVELRRAMGKRRGV